MNIVAAAAGAAAFLVTAAASPAAPPSNPCAAVGVSYGSAGAPLSSVPNDPLFTHQWGLTQIKAPQAWARGALGAGATIAIVDTGVDLNHPDLAGQLVPGRDFVTNELCTPGAEDLNGHGTHVAGIAAAATNNGIGGAGTAPLAKILPVRALDAGGTGSDSDVAAGIEWAADQGASVINLSLGQANGLPISSSVIAKAVDYAYSKGAVIVAAAGNARFPFCDDAAAAQHAICVAATDRNGFPSLYSNFPLRQDGGVAVRAPGGDGSGGCGDNNIWSTYWPGAADDSCAPKGYEPIAGTSMATPFVSGIAAMLRAAGLSNGQVMDCLARTSSNGGIYDPVLGYGNVNADAAAAGCTQLSGGGLPSGGQSGQSTGQAGLPGQTSPSGTQNGTSGSAAADSVAPRIRVAFSTSRRAHAARSGYVLLRVRLSERARVTLRVYSGRETAIAGRNAVLLARGVVSLRAGVHTVKLALSRVGRRVVHARRVTTATVLAAARDASGNDGTAIAEGKIRR